jgi:hypothetical protein
MVAKDEFGAAAFGAAAFDTVTAISALESTLSLFSNTLQLASMAFGFVPGMGGVAGVLSGISSGFDRAGKVVDGIDKVRDMSDKVLEIYREHPDPAAHPQVADALITKAFTLIQGGSLAEALSVYDDLADRFAADTDQRHGDPEQAAEIRGNDHAMPRDRGALRHRSGCGRRRGCAECAAERNGGTRRIAALRRSDFTFRRDRLDL